MFLADLGRKIKEAGALRILAKKKIRAKRMKSASMTKMELDAKKTQNLFQAERLEIESDLAR